MDRFHLPGRMDRYLKKINFVRGLVNGKTAKTGPFYVTFDITGRCNLQCIGCPYHSPLKSDSPPPVDFPFDAFERLCQELRDLGTHALVLQGSGEPFLHPDLFRMIETAKTKGFEVVLLTNGTFLNADRCKRLVSSGLDTLKVSLWATSPTEFKLNYPGISGSMLSRIVDGLQTISDIKKVQQSPLPETILYFVVNRYNCQRIDSAVDLAVSSCCNGIDFSIMHDASNEVAALMLDENETRCLCRDLTRIEKRLDAVGLTHNIGDFRFRCQVGEPVLSSIPCYIAWYHVRVGLDGRIFPCIRCAPQIEFGNTHIRSFQKIWNGQPIQDFRRLTLDRKVSVIAEKCDCRYCCFICDNMRVHKGFRLIRPFIPKVLTC